MILNKVVTERDGKQRTIEGNGLFRERGRGRVHRHPGHGERPDQGAWRGVGRSARTGTAGRSRASRQRLMDEFSTRSRAEIPEKLAELVDAYRETYGHDPDARDLASLSSQAARLTRDAKQDEDLTERVREWAQRAAQEAGEALAPLAGAVCGQAQAQPEPLSEAQTGALMARALSGLQARQSTWTRSDLTRAIGEALPANLPALDPADAAAFLPGLAERAIRGDAGQTVVALEAPELFTIPASLRRADGESVYDTHRGTRYATEAQLRMEGRIRDTAARRDPARAAHRAGRCGAAARRRRGAAAGAAGPAQPRGRHDGDRIGAASGPGRRGVLDPDQRPPGPRPGRPGRDGQEPDRRGDGARSGSRPTRTRGSSGWRPRSRAPTCCAGWAWPTATTSACS